MSTTMGEDPEELPESSAVQEPIFSAQAPPHPEDVPGPRESVAPPEPPAAPPAEYGSIALPEIRPDKREYAGTWNTALVAKFQQGARTLRLTSAQYTWALTAYAHSLLPQFAEHGEAAFERDGLVEAFAIHAKANGLTKTQAVGLWEWLATHHPEVKRRIAPEPDPAEQADRAKRAEVIARMQELARDNGQWKAEYKQLAAQAWALTEKLSKKSR